MKCKNEYTITNSVELAEKLNSMKIPNNQKFISLDITSLYSNTPVDEAIDILKQVYNISAEAYINMTEILIKYFVHFVALFFLLFNCFINIYDLFTCIIHIHNLYIFIMHW